MNLNAVTETRAAAWQIWLCRLCIVALVLALFGRTVGFNYVEWDDPGAIFENPSFRPVTSSTFVQAWSQSYMAIYMPVTNTIWAMLAMQGRHPTPSGAAISQVPFRLFGLLLHAGSSLLVFDILRRLVGNLSAALLGAALFAIHPVQVESVAWISGEKDLLGGFFVLAATWASLRSIHAMAWRINAWTYATIALGTLAMLSKPQALVAPLVIVVVLRTCAVPWRRVLTISLPLLIPAIVVAIVGRSAQPASVVPNVALWLRPVIALDAVVWYASKVVAPVKLVVDYGHRPQVVLTRGSTYLVTALAGVILIVVARLRRRQPLLAAGVAIAVLGPLPVLGLVKFDFQYYSTVADHYFYVGMFGVALIVAAVHRQLPWKSGRWIAFLMLLPLAVLSWRQIDVWHDTDALLSHNLAVNPTALGPGRILAFQASARGDDEAAVRLLKVTLASYPHDLSANYNLANALIRLGRNDEAAMAFERAIEANSSLAYIHHNYAILLIKLGRFSEAETQLRRAIELQPTSQESQQALAKLEAMRETTQSTQP